MKKYNDKEVEKFIEIFKEEYGTVDEILSIVNKGEAYKEHAVETVYSLEQAFKIYINELKKHLRRTK